MIRLDVDDSSRALVSSAPEVLFAADPPIVFDEWQVAPKALFDDDFRPARDPGLTVPELTERIVVGGWGALEVTMNPDDIDKAAASLVRFAAKVDTSKIGAPAFLDVVTTRAAALRRPEDGVLTLPIATLGP